MTPLEAGAAGPEGHPRSRVDMLQPTLAARDISTVVNSRDARQKTLRPTSIGRGGRPASLFAPVETNEQTGQAPRLTTATPNSRIGSSNVDRGSQPPEALDAQSPSRKASLLDRIFLDLSDARAWYGSPFKREPHAFAVSMISVFRLLQRIRHVVITSVFVPLDSGLVFAILLTDTILAGAVTLLRYFPLRPVAVFSSIVLGFRIPYAIWETRGWYAGSFAWLIYLGCAYRFASAYVYQPDAWTIKLSGPRRFSTGRLLKSVWLWHLFALGAIFYCELHGPAEPLLLERV